MQKGTPTHPARRRRILSLSRSATVGFVFMIALAAVPSSNAGAPGPEVEGQNETSRIEATPSTPPEIFRAQVAALDEAVPSAPAPPPARPIVLLNPAARLLKGKEAAEYWTLYIELDSGHRIAQQFLISNAGPGDHNAVAVGHLVEAGREPYRYENGRQRGRWTLSDDRLFFDIAASHLDLHRPTGQLRITKDDIEIHLFFEFKESDLAYSVPEAALPNGYHVEVLAVGAPTEGTLLAPWMKEPLETRGRTWLVHTWSRRAEAEIIDRRIDFFGFEKETSFYGMHLQAGTEFQRTWLLAQSEQNGIVESTINDPSDWLEHGLMADSTSSSPYPAPKQFSFTAGRLPGQITLGRKWLRFDPLAALPQPFRWFVRRKTKPEQVWADAEIRVTLLSAPETPSLPEPGETESDSNSKRETEEETAQRSVTGVASITFLNPSHR